MPKTVIDGLQQADLVLDHALQHIAIVHKTVLDAHTEAEWLDQIVMRCEMMSADLFAVRRMLGTWVDPPKATPSEGPP